MVAIKRLVQQTEPELLQLSERLVSGSLASSSAPSAAAITAVLRTDPALQRLAPRLHSTLAGAARSGGLRHGRQAAGRLFQQHDAAQQAGLLAQICGPERHRCHAAMQRPDRSVVCGLCQPCAAACLCRCRLPACGGACSAASHLAGAGTSFIQRARGGVRVRRPREPRVSCAS